MPLTQPKTDLAYLRSEKAKAEQQLRYYQHREKILEHQIPELTRKARVHRLCTRAGMLESFLIAPEELTNDQVMELLKISFRQPEVVLALAKMVHYVAGVVDSEDYQLIREDYSRQYDSLRTELQRAEAKKVEVEQQIREYLNMTSNLEEHLDDFGFDAQLVKSLVQRIEVSADKRIRIVFGFQDVFADLGKAHINHRQHPGGFEGASAAYAGLFLFSDFNTDGC